MRRSLVACGLVAIAVAAICGLWSFVAPVRAAQVLPSPDKLRFRLIADEPIATPDARGMVSGWKVVVVRDQKSISAT